MKTTFRIAIAAAMLAGATSLAMAQAGGSSSGSTGSNAAMSGGPGTHQSGGPKTGSASNTQKVQKNQNGYQGQQ